MPWVQALRNAEHCVLPTTQLSICRSSGEAERRCTGGSSLERSNALAPCCAPHLPPSLPRRPTHTTRPEHAAPKPILQHMSHSMACEPLPLRRHSFFDWCVSTCPTLHDLVSSCMPKSGPFRACMFWWCCVGWGSRHTAPKRPTPHDRPRIQVAAWAEGGGRSS